MKPGIYQEARHIWEKAASERSPEALRFEVDIYKKLLNMFHVGDYYYCIFSYLKKDFELVSTEVTGLLGYSPEEYSVPFLLSKVHPEDIGYLLNFENRAMDFLNTLTPENLTKYKIRHDYRLQKSNGGYIRVLQQGVVLEHDNEGGILRTLIIHTDITHLKPEGRPVLSFIGMEGEPSYIDVDVKKVFSISKDTLTSREKQVLCLMIQGKLSKEIGEILSISKHTVDIHRKNMLRKNNFNTTSELVVKAIKQGWV